MEYLIQGSPIYTLVEEPGQAVVEAMVIDNGVIKRIGSRRELAVDHPAAKVVDVEGGAVIPCFNDCHMHMVHLGLELGQADLRHCKTREEIFDTLKKWEEGHPNSEWIQGGAYNQNQLPDSRHITRQELDDLFTDKPVLLGHVSGHASVANSKAFELGGIKDDSPDPPDGAIDRDESGRPTGLLLENAIRILEAALPEPDDETLSLAVKKACDHLASMGILAASDAYTGWRLGLEKECRAYARALELGASLRLTLMPDVESAFVLGWEERSKAELPAAHPDLRLGPMKIMADGALTSRTAALLEPFIDNGSKGILIYKPDELIDRIVRSHLGGWQTAVHAIGDYAIQLCLDGFEKALALAPREDCRHRIEHCMVLNDNLLSRMADMNIMACAQPEFIHALGAAYKLGLGERAENLMPYKTWQDMGIPAAFSSDNPVTSGDPIIGWRAAVDRTGADGCVLGPEEVVDPISALKCYTIGSAQASFDQAVGQLIPGKQARFTVISHPPDEILNEDMRVVTTSYELMK